MNPPIAILALCGSLRSGSYNRMLLQHAITLLGEGFHVTVADIAALPHYNEDLNAAPPPEALAFLEQCHGAKGVLIATPEYNHSIGGTLKNAIDWASRPDFKTPLANKPVAILGASTGPVGTARAQQALRAMLYVLGVDLVAKPEVLVGMAAGKFDAQGQFIDEMGNKFLGQLLDAFKTKLLK